MSEFSGFHFSPLNATASGVRSDESDTVSFPQHLTSPPKPKCPHYNSGCLLESPPQGARESLKAQNSTTRVVVAARHQVADCWCVQGKAQGTIFPGEGENNCNETVISLGSLQRNLHFSTSAAQPRVNQTTDDLFQEKIKGAFVRQNKRMHLFPFCAV